MNALRAQIVSKPQSCAWAIDLGEADRSVGSRYASASIRRRNLARIATNDDAAAGGASMHGSNQWRR